MKTLKNLIYISVIASAAGACDVKQDLGETAGGTGTGGGSATGGTTGSADTGVLDTGPWGETGSGGTSEGTTGSGDTGVLDTGPWWGSSSDTGEETGEPLEDCDASDVTVRWDSTTITGETVGFDQFATVSGPCFAMDQSFVDSTFTLSMACELAGTVDGGEADLGSVDLDLVLEIDGATSDILPTLGPGLGINLWVRETAFGLGTERHLELYGGLPPEEVGIVLFLGDSQELTPEGGEGFANAVTLDSVKATCAAETSGACGEGRGIAGSWAGGPVVVAHTGQSAAIDSEVGTYDLFVDQAWSADDTTLCPEDAPIAHYRYVGIFDAP